MTQRGRPSEITDAKQTSVRLPTHVRDALARMHPQGLSYGIRRACEQYVEHAEDYVTGELELARQSVRQLERLEELVAKNRLSLNDQQLRDIKKRAKQTKLYGIEESKQRVWLAGRGFPLEQHDQIIDMIQELCTV